MRFINPRTDFAFKKIFGSAESRPILISFLNAILYEGEPVILDLEILDPYSVPRLQGMKDTYLDVRAQLRDGQVVLIEMQVLNLPGFEKRVLYNAAKEYSNQLQRGQDFHALNPVIALTITDFVMFAEPELAHRVISSFVLLEKDKLIRCPDGDVELVFVELPKFELDLDEIATLTEKWLYFLRAAPDIDVVPEGLSSVPEIGRAFEIAEYSRLSREEEAALEKKLRWVADQRSLLEGKRQAEEAARQAEETARQAEEKLSKAIAILRSSGMTDEEIAGSLGLEKLEGC
jgi:predicted transposase/invertase (TIGR01784 family)